MFSSHFWNFVQIHLPFFTMKRTGVARSNTASKATSKRQTVLPLAQKSPPAVHSKPAPTMSSPSIHKSQGEVFSETPCPYPVLLLKFILRLKLFFHQNHLFLKFILHTFTQHTFNWGSLCLGCSNWRGVEEMRKFMCALSVEESSEQVQAKKNWAKLQFFSLNPQDFYVIY